MGDKGVMEGSKISKNGWHHLWTGPLRFQGQYYIYLSAQYAHLGWHVGLTKRGMPKKGHKTSYPVGQKAIQFVRKSIVPTAPSFELDITEERHKDLTFIDEGHNEELHKGPLQVNTIKKV